MKPSYRTLSLLVVALGAAVTSSCGSSRLGSTGSVGTATGGAGGLSAFDPAAYFDLLGGDLSLQSVDSTAPEVNGLSAEAWRSLIAKERSVGLVGLTPAERSVVLSGAAKAYLTLVRSARFSIEIPGTDKTASITEVYSAAGSPDHSTLLDVEERQASGEGISAKFGDVPRLSIDSPDDSRMFNEFESDERVRTVFWTHGIAGWECRSVDQTGAYSLVALGRVALIDSIIGAPVGSETTARGRRAITYAPVSSGRRSTRITIDEETLWPTVYEYLDQSGGTVSRAELVDVNMSDSIPKPDDAATCTGE